MDGSPNFTNPPRTRYKADFVDLRHIKMAATVEVTATFSLVLFTIQTSKVPAEGNMM